MVKKFSYPNLKAENSTFTRSKPTEVGKITVSAVTRGNYPATQSSTVNVQSIAVEVVDARNFLKTSHGVEPEKPTDGSVSLLSIYAVSDLSCDPPFQFACALS